MVWSDIFFPKQEGVSKNRGTPKWMVYNGKPYEQMDDLGVFPIFFWKHPGSCSIQTMIHEIGQRQQIKGRVTSLTNFCVLFVSMKQKTKIRFEEDFNLLSKNKTCYNP